MLKIITQDCVEIIVFADNINIDSHLFLQD